MQKDYFTKLICALFVAAGLATAADPMPQVGSEAPGFTLPSQDGTPVTLKDLRGKWVVLYFYPKDGTTGCTLEAHNFQRDLRGYEAHNAMIVGVSIDSTGSHKEFCAKQGLTFKLLADDQKRVTPMYGSLESLLGFKIAARNTFLIDPQGKIAKVWTGVSPSRHSSEVLAALDNAERH
jgi:peroxiredoxin Q/BCP